LGRFDARPLIGGGSMVLSLAVLPRIGGDKLFIIVRIARQ